VGEAHHRPGDTEKRERDQPERRRTSERETELGHVADPDLTVTLGYDLARTLIVDQKPEVAAKAWMAGRIRTDGDLSKLLPTGDPMALVDAATEAPADPIATEIRARIRAATA